MSEVMRWKLKGFLPGVEGMCKAVMRPEVVLSSDYDAAQSELTALKAELASEEKDHAELRDVVAALREELAALKYDCQVNNSVINAQKEDLAAAEQTNALLISAIVSLPDEFKELSGCENTAGVYVCIEHISGWVEALTKPTESGASE